MPIIKAFSEGKEIEGIYKGLKEPWFNVKDMVFDGGTKYRIKPSPTYRPFANAEECWQEMQKHQPFGWVETCAGAKTFINTVSDDYFYNGYNEGQEFSESLNYRFADGKPFGIKEDAE